MKKSAVEFRTIEIYTVELPDGVIVRGRQDAADVNKWPDRWLRLEVPPNVIADTIDTLRALADEMERVR